jgi:hypothetical protein
MHKLLATTLACMAILSAAALSAVAGPVEPNRRLNTHDPLHAFCIPQSACTDNGRNTPTDNPKPDFGFTVSPGPATGTYYIDILVPNSEVSTPNAVTFNITGTQGGALNNMAISATGTLVNPVAWTTGALDAYLGKSASPNNPIGAYLGPCPPAKPCTKNLVPDATGFYVYEANLGTNHLADNGALSGPMTGWGPLLHLTSSGGGFSPNVPLAAFAVAFLKTDVENARQIATANSGALFIRKIPEPASLGLLGVGLAALAFAQRRRVRRAAR